MVRFFPVHRRIAHDGWRNFGGDFETINFGGHFQFVATLKELSSQPDTATVALVCRKTNHHFSGIFYHSNPLDDTFSRLLLNIILVILITHVVRFLLKPFNQPKIISQIIGGLIIGPSVIGQEKKFSAAMFPGDSLFMLSNIGIMGFMYFLFISGVKMDMGLIRKSGKKEILIASSSVLIPLTLNIIVACILRKSMDKELARISSIGAVTSLMAITSFPVIYPVLQELNLLSSEVGRMALSTTIISDAIGINAIIAFEAIKQGDVNWLNALWYLISLTIFLLFIVVCVRRLMRWIVSRTPEGKPVRQVYVVSILLGVLVMGFLSDMIGAAIANGPLWLGLVIPDGPPLGSTLVERSELIIMELLMPFSFAFIGLCTDVSAMSMVEWSTLAPMFYMVITGYFFKLIATFLAFFFFQVPPRDSLALSLIMSLRGQMELILFLHWIDKKIITVPSFTMLVLLTTAATAIITPFISILYDPTRPYMVNKRRTIQHNPLDTGLKIVLCIEHQENVAALINFLEISNPTINSPFSIYALHLIELVGRAAPVFIDHKKQEAPTKYTASDNILNALKLYEEARSDLVKVHAYTAVAPRKSVNQDICELALIKKANLIVMPFIGGSILTELGSFVVKSVNLSVLEHAPCSVGILVDKSQIHNPLVGQAFWNSAQHLAVLFLGGADSREALSFVDRMIGNLDVYVTVVRFLSHNSRGDNELEKKLDDGVVTWFWVKNEANDRVLYREVVVCNGDETIAAIRSINHNSYDLVIVGRKEGINPVLLEGLSSWSENQELGVIGEYVASADFNATAYVLVIQQQVLRRHRPFSYGSCGKFRCQL